MNQSISKKRSQWKRLSDSNRVSSAHGSYSLAAKVNDVASRWSQRWSLQVLLVCGIYSLSKGGLFDGNKVSIRLLEGVKLSPLM